MHGRNYVGKDATADFEDVGHSSDAILESEEFVIGHIDVSTLPPDEDNYMSQNASSSPNNTSTTDSYNPLLFVLPLFIVGLALFLRVYSKKNEDL